jgi:hypothetical protein
MLAAIDETLESDGGGEVMGMVVNTRKSFYRIGVWTKTVGKSVSGGGEGDVAGGKGRSPEKSKEMLIGVLRLDPTSRWSSRVTQRVLIVAAQEQKRKWLSKPRWLGRQTFPMLKKGSNAQIYKPQLCGSIC